MNNSPTVVEAPETTFEKLLDLIDQGDPTVILSSENTFNLNELFRHEFIFINMEKLELTEKGRKAKEVGVRPFLDQQELSGQHQVYTSNKIDKVAFYKPFLSMIIFLLTGLLSILIWMVS